MYEAFYLNKKSIYEVSAYPYEDGLTVFIKDITQKKQAEAQLSELQSRFESIINSAMDAIITTDEDKNIILFNQAAEKMFGYTADEVLGKSIYNLISESFRQIPIHPRQEADAGSLPQSNVEKGLNITTHGYRWNNEEFPIEASLSETVVEDKKYLTIIVRDITSRKQAE